MTRRDASALFCLKPHPQGSRQQSLSLRTLAIQKELNLVKRNVDGVFCFKDLLKSFNYSQKKSLNRDFFKHRPNPLGHLFVVYEITSPEAFARILKPKLKADKIGGKIIIDGFDTLEGIPNDAWNYKIGNRSALEWVVDQYKESKPKDPTIADKFNTYRFSDYKNQVIDLPKRVCTVSVETMKIVKQMEDAIV